MLRDITLGQYYPADSVIHKLDPRVKLFATFIYIISLFCFKGIAALLVATVFLIFCIRTSKVPFKFMVKWLEADRGADADHGGIQSFSDTWYADREILDL